MTSSEGWYNLLSLLAEPPALIPLSACPNDGEPLTDGPDGRLFCRFDGWRPE